MREKFMYMHFFAGIVVVQEGRDPLPRCDLCGIHMPAGRLLKHQQKQQCEGDTQMLWRRRDVKITSRCAEAAFSLTGEDKAECIKGVETFIYLGRILDRSDNDWPAVLRNVGKACRVWSRLGKLLRREGEEPRVSVMFYRAVVQAVLILEAETWVLLEAMSRKLEGLHVGFLRQITGQRAVRWKDGT